jgi:hypothetical protein
VRTISFLSATVISLGLALTAACGSDALSSLDSTDKGASSGKDSPGDGDGGLGTASAGDSSGPSGLPCDVDAIVKQKCQNCHGADPTFGAPQSLVTHDQLAAVAPRVIARIKDAAKPMPPVPNPTLSAAEISTLEGWVNGGMPTSTEACRSAPSRPTTQPLNCTPDQHLQAPTPYEMQQGGGTDQYVCVGVDITNTQKRHITAMGPKVDNAKILHHILVFQSTTSFGNVAKPCQAFDSKSWRLMGGWAPGGTNLELPAEAGYPEEKGVTHWVVQFHYNNANNLAGQKDNSGFELCTTDQLRPNDAAVLAFGTISINLPPHSDVSTTCDYTLGTQFAKGAQFFNASPHMHTRGTGLGTVRIPKGSTTPETIFDHPNFSFENQANFPIQKQATQGDVMRTTCKWKNTSDQSISFGENTSDEMCFDFLGYYPAIPDQTLFGLPIFTWITPSAMATCK